MNVMHVDNCRHTCYHHWSKHTAPNLGQDASPVASVEFGPNQSLGQQTLGHISAWFTLGLLSASQWISRSVVFCPLFLRCGLSSSPKRVVQCLVQFDWLIVLYHAIKLGQIDSPSSLPILIMGRWSPHHRNSGRIDRPPCDPRSVG